jgi:hypothetical protein
MGAGILRLPLNANVWWGSTTVTNGQTQEITFNAAPTSSVDAAIWWPESPSTHNDVDLSTFRPGETSSSSFSTSISSVFEKNRTTLSLGSGNWKIKINGYSVTGTQTVYYAISSR